MKTAQKKSEITKKRSLEGLTLLSRNHKEYPDSPEKAKLEFFENAFPQRNYVIEFDCPEFTSKCPVTGQPDFGHIKVRYIADKRCVESKSLKLYLFSFRNENTFHEEAVNRILSDLTELLKPRWMRVEGVFRPRGGIAISVAAEEGSDPSLAQKVLTPVSFNIERS